MVTLDDTQTDRHTDRTMKLADAATNSQDQTTPQKKTKTTAKKKLSD